MFQELQIFAFVFIIIIIIIEIFMKKCFAVIEKKFIASDRSMV
jgi:hypothetical protein